MCLSGPPPPHPVEKCHKSGNIFFSRTWSPCKWSLLSLNGDSFEARGDIGTPNPFHLFNPPSVTATICQSKTSFFDETIKLCVFRERNQMLRFLLFHLSVDHVVKLCRLTHYPQANANTQSNYLCMGHTLFFGTRGSAQPYQSLDPSGHFVLRGAQAVR